MLYPQIRFCAFRLFRIFFWLISFLIRIKEGEAQTHSQLIPKKGWYITTREVNWAMGSEINFFNAQRNQHHYYFTWWEQDTDSSVPQTDILKIGSSNTAVEGTFSLKKQPNRFQAAIRCTWHHNEDGSVDIVYLKLWLPFFRDGEWYAGNKKLSSEERLRFHDTSLTLVSPLGTFRFSSSYPFRIRQNDHPRPAEHEFDKRSQYLMFYEEKINLAPGSQLYRNFTVEDLTTIKKDNEETASFSLLPAPVQNAWIPPQSEGLLLPKPKSYQRDTGYYFLPEGKPRTPLAMAFHQMLRRRWMHHGLWNAALEVQRDAQLPDEGYRLKVLQDKIIIEHKDSPGLQHALYSLYQLAVAVNGRLAIPKVSIEDYPSLSWRGIHMFCGPTSWPLHRKMYEQVLFPLKMNKLVLQCEQARWKSFPNIHNPISIPLPDLKAEFDFLRRHHVEPIPLIQSLGHMEWFFKPPENRKLAVNPLYPYTLNAFLPEARRAIKTLWDEACRLLRPQTIHIGFDEIGMIGFHWPREKEEELWNLQLPFLHRLANRYKTKLMLWGDMALGPGEGPDALHGKTKERVARLRSVIPKGSYVADWHYINNPDPEIFKTSLRIWKNNGQFPIASTWFRENNIRGFTLAAIDEKAGLLQTTWADFESSEKNMLLNIEQFGAYVLAMDYAWSGRKELPEQLAYHPVKEWTARFYEQPKPIQPRNGHIVPASATLQSRCIDSLQEKPQHIRFITGKRKISGFRWQAYSYLIVPEGTPVALLQCFQQNQKVYEQTLLYGVDLRSEHDARPLFTSLAGHDKHQRFVFFNTPLQADEIRLQLLHKGCGLRLQQLVLLD
ncbi:MAG: hypothetical protein N2747_09645 [Chitinophagaceae bacterium]|nr:hypothetical protein [Chitinophagaceae bacterium]